MKLAHFIPPVISQGLTNLIRRSLAGWSPAAWLRGDDIADGPAARLARPYAQSAWIHAAVDYVTAEISGRPVKFYQGDKEYTDPAFDDWWAAPALGPKTAGGIQPRLTQAEAKRDCAAWAMLEGEFFLLFDDSWAMVSNRRRPAALTPFVIAKPKSMRAIIAGAELQGWEYIDAGGRRSVYLPEQVIHWKAFNPYDDWRGLGDLEAATVAAEASFYTGVYIRELMRNNGDTGFIVVGKAGAASPEQTEQIQAALRHKRAALAAGRPVDLFLSGGDMSVERPKEQAAGEGVISAKGLSHQEIFVAFKVPPSMAEVKQSYSIGKESDRYQLINGRCQPLGDNIAGTFALAGSRMSGLSLTAELEWDDHPVMIEIRNSRITTLTALTGLGMPVKHANDYLDLGMKPYPGWDVGYLPFSVVPVDAGGFTPDEPSTTPALDETNPAEEDSAVKHLRLLLLAKSRTQVKAAPVPVVEADALAAFQCGCPAHGSKLLAPGYTAQKADRPPAEIARWRQHMKDRRAQVKGFESRFRAALFKARSETLANIAANGAKSVGATIAKTAVADLIFNLAGFAADFTAGMRKQHKLALDAAGKQVFLELGKDDPFEFAPADVLQFISGRENKLAGVPPDVFGRIQATLQAGLDAGDSTADLAARVRAEFNAIDKGRSQVIAQTEVAAAYGYGRNEAMVQAGVEFKAWLTSGNANVRSAHQEAGLTYPADGGIPLDEPFIVDGEALQYPGDPSGSPGNTINCHCVQIAVVAPEEV